LRQRCIAALLITSLAASYAPSVFAQSEEDRAGARAAATEGAQAFRDQKWADAADLFTRAESLVHAPPHLLYLARAQTKLGQLVKAQENYNKIIRENLPATAPKAFHDAQGEAAKEIKDVEARIAYVKATVKGQANNLKVTMDGTLVPPALVGVQRPVDPGEHKFQASGDGMTSDVVAVTVKEGGHQAVEITLKPGAAPPMAAAAPTAPSAPAPSDSTPPASSAAPASTTAPATTSLSTENAPAGGSSGLMIGGFVALGVGLVGFGVAGAFAAKASGKHSDADSLYDQYKCQTPGPNNCSPNGQQRQQILGLDDDANSAKKTANLGMVVGLVGVVGGAALLVLSMGGGQKEKSSATRATVTPWIGPSSAGLSGAF
jgi:hypothetical protein